MSQHPPTPPRYRLPALLALAVLALAPPAGADPATHTIAVDCSKGKSIQQALAHPADELVIEISGMCQERVVISRHNVTLIGTDPATDGITGPAVADAIVQRALVRIIDARNVRLENLAITASEHRGLEGYGLSFIELDSCRITGNGGRGVQMNNGAIAEILDSEIADNGGSALIVFGGAQIGCEGCTVGRLGGIPVAALDGGKIFFTDSTISTDAPAGVVVDDAYVEAEDSNMTSGLIALYAALGGKINWIGGELAGAAWAETASQLYLAGVTQTANLPGNFLRHDSYLELEGGTLIGDTHLTEFSTGTSEAGATFGTVTCDRGGEFHCDGTETKAGSGCGMCP